jgi:hypothetical protein
MSTDSDTSIGSKSEPIPVCPVCCGQEVSFYQDVFDDRYGHPGLFKLMRCRDCGHLMTRPTLTEDDLAHLYGTYYPRKNITSEQVTAAAAKFQRTFSGLRRWLMGVDNQGQYSARP